MGVSKPEEIRFLYQQFKERPKTVVEGLTNDQKAQIHELLEQAKQKKWSFINDTLLNGKMGGKPITMEDQVVKNQISEIDFLTNLQKLLKVPQQEKPKKKAGAKTQLDLRSQMNTKQLGRLFNGLKNEPIELIHGDQNIFLSLFNSKEIIKQPLVCNGSNRLLKHLFAQLHGKGLIQNSNVSAVLGNRKAFKNSDGKLLNTNDYNQANQTPSNENFILDKIDTLLKEVLSL